jgi:serine acetyltransferase
MKERLGILYLASKQIDLIIKWSSFCAKAGFLGRAISVCLDNLLLTLYGLEVTSKSLEIRQLSVGHSTGVVLGGNGIRCSGTLHVSSGVVFARRYSLEQSAREQPIKPMFVINGDLTIGANSVLLGPLSIEGPTIIGALSLVTKNITEPGVYVGCPAKKIRDTL